MSDNELRDRIARILHGEHERQYELIDTRHIRRQWDNLSADARANWTASAQAVIDDLGLTVEERFVYATDLQQDGEPFTSDMAQRVVGRWEKQ